jgi:hypothetical protein
MRAIMHLGFFRGLFEPSLIGRRDSSESVSGEHSWINGLRRFAIKHLAEKSLSKFHPTRINPLQASQNAAALLFDLGIVDIR